MKMRFIIGFVFLLSSSLSYAETFYEVSAGVSRYAIDIVSKRGPTYEDTSDGVIATLAAYRQISHRSAWGAAIEYTEVASRDDDLLGDGGIFGFRILNYLRDIGRGNSVELYAGAAQYNWEKTANGYLLGLAYRLTFVEDRMGITLDSKYYQDLAYDSDNGDEIVDGYHSSIKFFYRF